MRQLGVAFGLALIWFGGVYWLTRQYTFFPFLLALLAWVSLVTLLLYGWDKRAAMHQRQRTPENTLHLFSLLGGWPGALIARPLFRHKTRKQPFTTIFWLTAVISAALLIVLLRWGPIEEARNWLDVEALQWRILVQQYRS